MDTVWRKIKDWLEGQMKVYGRTNDRMIAG